MRASSTRWFLIAGLWAAAAPCSEFDIVGEGASEASAMFDAEQKAHEFIARKAQQAANHAKCLCPILREFDPDTQWAEYKAAWEAAKRGDYAPSTQGIITHQLMAREFQGKSFNVSLKVGGNVVKRETWHILTEVQIAEADSFYPWRHKGEICGLGQTVRKKGVRVADTMIFSGEGSIGTGSRLSDLCGRWRFGVDYKTVSAASTVEPKVSPRLAALLADQFGSYSGAKYRAVRLIRPRGLATAPVGEINKMLRKCIPGKSNSWYLTHAKKIAGRFGRLALIGAGVVLPAAAQILELDVKAEQFVKAMEEFVAYANRGAAPNYFDGRILRLAEATEDVFGLPYSSANRMALMGKLFEAAMNIHNSRDTEDLPANAEVDDFLAPPFVEVEGEAKIKFAETTP